jgi:hypothetical protein
MTGSLYGRLPVRYFGTARDERTEIVPLAFVMSSSSDPQLSVIPLDSSPMKGAGPRRC